MFRIHAGTTHDAADVEDFVRLINTLDAHPLAAARILFAHDRPLVVARAPGRLDVMGGVADYSGSLVLEMPIREATRVAVQFVRAPTIRIVSLGGDDVHRTSCFEMPRVDFGFRETRISYDAAKRYFSRDPRQHWAAYVAGCWLVLMRERGFPLEHGANILIDSSVPEGKSVSSSAAIEVATMTALWNAIMHTRLDEVFSPQGLSPEDLAMLCQKVENLVAGAPCGIMDQMTSACGRAGELLPIRCQPAELLEPIRFSANLGLWGLDSGVRHSVGGSDYGSVRVGAFMGYRIIADVAGLPVRAIGDGVVEVDDERWGGYLANVRPKEFEARFAACLPETIGGREFLERYGGTTDSVTRVDAARTYAVRTPAAHPIHENARVGRFADLLEDIKSPHRLQSLGQLMYESHASYSACGLGSGATDRLVELVRQAGPEAGLYGAKITGGGSGGTVAVLGRHDAQPAIDAVVEEYAVITGYRPYVFTGSSAGAAAFGTRTLEPA